MRRRVGSERSRPRVGAEPAAGTLRERIAQRAASTMSTKLPAVTAEEEDEETEELTVLTRNLLRNVLMRSDLDLEKRFPPFPDSGGKIVFVNSMEDFESVLTKAKADGAIVVADFYHRQAPPCREAEPKFARWSEVFLSTIFIRVDLGEAEAEDVRTSQGISGVPTCKFYQDGACIETIEGFYEEKIAAKLSMLDPVLGKLPTSLRPHAVMAKQEYNRIKAKVVHYGPPYNAECVGRARVERGASRLQPRRAPFF